MNEKIATLCNVISSMGLYDDAEKIIALADDNNSIYVGDRKVNARRKGTDYIIIGDSQAGGGLGRKLSSKLGGSRYWINGSGSSSWKGILENITFHNESKSYSAKGVYVLLGGNDKGRSNPSPIIKSIREVLPEAPITWFGPPPPAVNGSWHKKSGYNYWGRIVDRKESNKALKAGVVGRGIFYVDLFEELTLKEDFNAYSTISKSYKVVKAGEPGYKCPGQGVCDGIHLPDVIAGNIVDKYALINTTEALMPTMGDI